jgi:uncharacterized membrane-anchored protein
MPMKKNLLLSIAVFASIIATAEDDKIQLRIDSIEKSFTYSHGTISLRNGIGKIVIPQGFKYLEPIQAERVLVDLWGNPKSAGLTQGLILPEKQGVFYENGYVFNIQYDEIGYVKDDDADDIDYNDLLKEMQTETEEANKERQKNGYEPISIIGWAVEPFYDKNRKILHWAKEVKFGNQEINTLNYNIRVLGRKGVLVINAISTMSDLALVKKDLNKVLDIVQFSDGNQYKNFDPGIDKVAVWTIGGLVAGKLLAKVGFFVILLKFWKLIAIAVIGLIAPIWKKIRQKKENSSIAPDQNTSSLK